MHGVEIKSLALALNTLVDGTQVYLNKIGAFYTSQAESDNHFIKFKEYVNKVVTESTPTFNSISDFEDRIYTQLNKHGAKLKYQNKEAEAMGKTKP